MPDDTISTPPTAQHGPVAALANPDAVSADSDRATMIDRHRLESYQQMRLYRAELTEWLLELLAELFRAQLDRVVFNLEEGPFGGYGVQLVAAWDRADRLLWRGAHAEHLEAHGHKPIGEPVLAEIEARRRTVVEELIDRIESADYAPWFADVGLHLDRKGIPLPPPESCPLPELREVAVADAREQIARLKAETSWLAPRPPTIPSTGRVAADRPGEFAMRDITAKVDSDTDGRRFAEVALTLAAGDQVTLTVHPSMVNRDTINVEIDGDFTRDNPSLRINLNDNLIHDSTRNDEPVDDPRCP